MVAPGKIRSISTATFIKFGELDNRRSERVERLRQAFGKTSVKADIPADIHKALWEKFLLVTAFGGVGAVSRAPIGIIRTISTIGFSDLAYHKGAGRAFQGLTGLSLSGVSLTWPQETGRQRLTSRARPGMRAKCSDLGASLLLTG